MKQSTFSRAARLILAGALVTALVNCGGSSDSSSNRDSGRNAALEDCATTTTAASTTTTTTAKKSDKKDKKESDNKDSEENKNGENTDNVSSEDCNPGDQYGEASQEPRECEVNWNAETKTVTFCDSFNRFEVVQKDKDGKTVSDGESSVDSADGTNAVTITLKDKVRKVKVSVFQKDPGGQLVKAADTEFRTASTTKTSFEYTPQPPATTTTVAAPDTTMAPDTTVAAPDTTMAPDTTVAAPDSTVVTNSVDTTLAPDTTMPDNGDLVPVVVQRTDCQAHFDVTTYEVKVCQAFDYVYVAMYDNEGTFAGKVEGNGSAVTIGKELFDQGIRIFRIEVGNKMTDGKTPRFLGEGFLILSEDNEDEANLLIDTAGTWVSDTGWESSAEIDLQNGIFDARSWWYEADGSTVFFEINGKIVSTGLSAYSIPDYKPGDAVTWKAFETDGMGLPRLVASGVITEPEFSDTISYYSNSFELDKEVIQFFPGMFGIDVSDPEIAAPSDACQGVQPFMVTDPATPARSNMITITVDADCKDPNHMIGAILFGDGWYPTWSQFLQTKYTQRIHETVYVPDGNYFLAWGTSQIVGWHEFIVNGGDNGPECSEGHLRVDTEAQTGELTNCILGNGKHSFKANLLNTDFEPVDVPSQGNTLDFSKLNLKGWFWVWIDDIHLPMRDFTLCLTDCDIPQADFTVDQSTFTTNGQISADYTCPAEARRWPEYWSGVNFFRQYRDGYAFEWSAYHDDQKRAALNDGGKVLVNGYCNWFGDSPDDGEWAWGTVNSLKIVDIAGTPNGTPANDNFADATVIPSGTGRADFSTVRGTAEKNEHVPWWGMSGRETNFSSVWFKFTATESKTTRLRFENSTFCMDLHVYKQTSNGLGMLTGGWWCPWTDTEDFPWAGAWFNTRTGDTYYIQISSNWMGEVGSSTLILNDGSGATLPSQWGMADGGSEGDGGGSDTTVAQGSDTTVAQGSDTTVAQSSDTTVARGADTTVPAKAPDTTAPSKAPDTTVARQSDTTSPSKAPDTTIARGSDTTAPKSTDNGPTTTVVLTKDQQAAEAYSDTFKAGDQKETANVETPVGGGQPVVEVRESVNTVEIPVVDIYATLNSAGGVSKADISKGVTIFVKGSRPIHVASNAKTVRIPVGAKSTDVAVTGRSADGKAVGTTIVVKKTKPSLLNRGGDSSSNTTLYIIIAAVILLLGGGYMVMSRKKEDGAEA